MGFAVKDAIDMTIKKVGDSTDTGVTIDYLNECSISLKADTVYAQKKGMNAIAFNGAREGTFTMNAEVIGFEYLAWMLGGSITTDEDGKYLIKVSGSVPSTKYIIDGTFNCVFEDGTEVIQYIKMYNAKPQVEADLTLSATDVSKFPLTFDILIDSNNAILDLSNDKTKITGAEAGA